MIVDSPNALFDEALRASSLVEEAAEDFKWKAFPSTQEAIGSGVLTMVDSAGGVPGGGPAPHADALEPLQWSIRLIRAPQAHAVQAGSPLVEVGILDSGVDAAHVDLSANVDCVKARDFVPLGPSISVGGPCNDNQFHGTHVAGIVAGAINGVGIVGVAPKVKLVPVKVCDPAGYCYSSATDAGITYAGDAKLEVINMSFFVDDDQLLQSTEFKCMSDPVRRAFRKANERAIQYARNQGVVPVAALGNSDNDLAHPPEPYENECEVVPAETQGGQFGRLGSDPGEPDVVMRPASVDAHMQATAIDIGLLGYDECFGHGRVDAVRAVLHDTSGLVQPNPPCPEYAE